MMVKVHVIVGNQLLYDFTLTDLAALPAVGDVVQFPSRNRAGDEQAQISTRCFVRQQDGDQETLGRIDLYGARCDLTTPAAPMED